MNMNQPAPAIRIPALMDGNLTYLSTADLHGRCLALCFLPPLRFLECLTLERQCPKFHERDSLFLGVVSEACFFSGPWHRRLWPGGLLLLGDPLGRLSRHYGITGRHALTRCQSFLIDPAGILYYHLVHDFNEQGITALLEILTASQVPALNRSVTGSRHREYQNLETPPLLRGH
jgi:alkyl hydroperoxide reductase subunit AhpC